MTKAIILAAGRGERLMPYTTNTPKCLIELVPGKTFLDNQLRTLKSAGIKDVIIVTGYHSEKIKRACTKHLKLNITFFENLDYMNSGTLNSMSLAREEFDDDLIVLNSDIIFKKRILKNVIETPGVCAAMELQRFEEGATCMALTNNRISDMGFLSKSAAAGLSVGIIKFPKEKIEKVKLFLEDYPVNTRCFVFNLVKYFIEEGEEIFPAFAAWGDWCEIDTPEDLNLYKGVIDMLLG